MSVIIREALRDDLAAAASLYARVASQVLSWEPPETHTQAKFLAQIADEVVWVAVAEGSVVGIAAFYRPDNFLHSLFVDAAWQGRGVGKALLNVVSEAAAAPLSLKVQDRNRGAIRFYLREGFQPSCQGETDGSGWTLMVRGSRSSLEF